jgi:Flp pilus assembly protein TadB
MRELAFTQLLQRTPLGGIESIEAPIQQAKELSKLTVFEQQLVRAEISLSPTVFVALCITLGFILFSVGLLIGPLFAIFFGLTICFELLFAFPRERAFRRAQRAARQLPLLLETLGHQVHAGLSFESSLAKSLPQIPRGELAILMAELMRKLERGGDLNQGLEELCDHCRLPDFRLFTQVVKMFGRGGRLYGDAFVQLALFLRSYRENLSQLQRRAHVQRICFLLFTGLFISGAMFYAYMVPVVWAPVRSYTLGFLREIGACMIIMAVLVAMRITSAFSFEGYE